MTDIEVIFSTTALFYSLLTGCIGRLDDATSAMGTWSIDHFGRVITARSAMKTTPPEGCPVCSSEEFSLVVNVPGAKYTIEVIQEHKKQDRWFAGE